MSGHRQPQSEEQIRNTIMRLSELLDLVGLTTHIVEESKYGKRPHPKGDKWGYLKDFMLIYAPKSNVQDVIALFESVGATDDHSAARWLLRNDKLVP